MPEIIRKRKIPEKLLLFPFPNPFHAHIQMPFFHFWFACDRACDLPYFSQCVLLIKQTSSANFISICSERNIKQQQQRSVEYYTFWCYLIHRLFVTMTICVLFTFVNINFPSLHVLERIRDDSNYFSLSSVKSFFDEYIVYVHSVQWLKMNGGFVLILISPESMGLRTLT